MGHEGSIFTCSARLRLKTLYSGSWIGLDSPLIHAIRDFESEELAYRFAAHGYDVDDKWRGHFVRTALYYCCELSSLESFQRLALVLLKLGADPNVMDESTCLQCTIKSGAWDLYEIFLEHPKLVVDLPDNQGRTALHSLIQHTNTARFSHFLGVANCDINAQDSKGNTPLHLATVSRNIEMMKCLLDDPRTRLDIIDKQGRTALTLATYWGYKDAALLIIQCTHSFPAPADNEISGLVLAAKQHQKDVVFELLSKYSNLTGHTDEAGRGLLHHCAINDWPDVLEVCFSPGAHTFNISQIDHSGATAIHYAASLGNIASLMVLLKTGANIRFQDRNGRTAAHAAADAGFEDALVLLLGAPGLDANQRDNMGRNLVHWVASCEWTNVVATVLQQPDADLMCRDRYGISASRHCVHLFLPECRHLSRSANESSWNRFT